MKITTLTEYTPGVAARVRELLVQLSRSGKDKGEIPEQWFRDIIESPWHDLLIAVDESGDDDAGSDGSGDGIDDAGASSDGSGAGRIVGFASLSVLMGPGIRKNAYLEDFVTDASVRGQGVGSALWAAMLDWARVHGCQHLEFTCGHGREAAQRFYKNHGAEVYDTNFFRLAL